MKVLYVASEAAPFIKTGGLADVAGSFPQAMQSDDVEIAVIIPKYHVIPEEFRNKMEHVYNGTLRLAWREKYIGLDKMEYNGVTYYFVENDDYYHRATLYGYDDDAERFAFFCRAVLSLFPAMDFWPDLIHMNDWHAALISVFLRLDFANDPRYANIKTLFTIHNLKYQGVFTRDYVTYVLGLDNSHFTSGLLEHKGALNFMKSGLVTCDAISTVSRTYAREIQDPYFGESLDGILRDRSAVLTGIVNGIDVKSFDPEEDEAIYFAYNENSFSYKKPKNKIELQRQLGLKEDLNVPLIAIVSRLVEPKGIDLAIRILDELVAGEDVQLAVLGTGDRFYEEWFMGLAWRFPTKVSVNIGYSDELARRIYAASTIFLMPSAYEPCGVADMIAMRYGSIPVVHAIGGLRDVVTPFDKEKLTGNGFTFESYNAHDFLFAIKRALGVYAQASLWNELIKNAMSGDYSWTTSAKQYKELYTNIIAGN